MAYTVIHLGGSIVVPHISDEGGISIEFLKKFRLFLKKQLKKGKSFIIVVGGGKTARVYQKAASQVLGTTPEDLDWIGIVATKLNAQLLLSMLRAESYSQVIDRKPSKQELQTLKKSKKNLYIVSGWYPGQSTDYEALWLAREFGAREVVNASNIPFAYDKDPKKYKDAKPIREISWREYRKLIPQKWSPGLSAPIDPIAVKLAEKAKIQAKIIRGTDLKNFKKAIEGKQFVGTIIQ